MGTLDQTSDQLLAFMDAEQSKIPALAAVKSSSQVALFTTLKKLFATLWLFVAADVKTALADIKAASAQYQVGTLDWYVTQARAFQFGFPTVVVAGRVGYTTDVPTARIIAQAAAVEDPATARLLIKVVKKDPSGLVPLASDELNAFRAYMGQVKWAGTALDVVSLGADELKLQVVVKIDPKVFSANGASLLDPSTRPVPAAIQAYLRQLPFNGELSWTALTDFMQAIPGVQDFLIQKAWSRDAGLQGWTEFSRSLSTRAGHVNLIVSESSFTYL